MVKGGLVNWCTAGYIAFCAAMWKILSRPLEAIMKMDWAKLMLITRSAFPWNLPLKPRVPRIHCFGAGIWGPCTSSASALTARAIHPLQCINGWKQILHNLTAQKHHGWWQWCMHPGTILTRVISVKRSPWKSTWSPCSTDMEWIWFSMDMCIPTKGPSRSIKITPIHAALFMWTLVTGATAKVLTCTGCAAAPGPLALHGQPFAREVSGWRNWSWSMAAMRNSGHGPRKVKHGVKTLAKYGYIYIYIYIMANQLDRFYFKMMTFPSLWDALKTTNEARIWWHPDTSLAPLWRGWLGW